jgi:glycosyltransferase involved in cell wall biosynthesis
MEEGGAPRILISLMGGLNHAEFSQTLISGPGPEGLDILDEVKNFPIEIKMISTLGREINPVLDLIGLFRLLSELRRNRYDIIHTHTSKGGFLGRLAAKISKSRRVIYSPHGNIFSGYFPGWETRLYVYLEKLAASWCDRIVTLSDIGARQFLERGIGREGQYKTIYNGIDIKSFAEDADRKGIRGELGIGDGDVVIICVGRMVFVKGHRILIDASPKIIEGIKDRGRVFFVMVGDGPLRGELERRSRELGISKNFIFLGFRSDVAKLLSGADLLVMPSLNEGLGMSMVEAMALSLPVVGTDVGGIPEVVKHGVTGMLVPPDDSGELARACIEVIKNPKRAKEMGIQGKKRAEMLFDIKGTIRATENLYRELMGEIS